MSAGHIVPAAAGELSAETDIAVSILAGSSRPAMAVPLVSRSAKHNAAFGDIREIEACPIRFGAIGPVAVTIRIRHPIAKTSCPEEFRVSICIGHQIACTPITPLKPACEKHRQHSW
ncbi:hypothetical protein [Aquamicrobium defluvii]|uniref:hypothetical protein n=1 Tax=Aquamicrobium defluvii TaxID=69279 RepID=UPI0018DEB4E4|nr:hypothetical protein [Aquamicrobium defluvii]